MLIHIVRLSSIEVVEDFRDRDPKESNVEIVITLNVMDKVLCEISERDTANRNVEYIVYDKKYVPISEIYGCALVVC